MIRYYCNGCSNLINREDVTGIIIQSAHGGKQNLHFCPRCSVWVTKLVTGYKSVEPDKEPVVTDDESVDEPEDRDETTNESDDHAESSEDCQYSGPLGPRVDELFAAKPIIFMDKIRADVAEKYLKPRTPNRIIGHTDIPKVFSGLVSLYRGIPYREIRRRLRSSDPALDTMFMRYASLYAYERWFTKKEFVNKAGDVIDVGEVLACVENRASLKDIMLDTDIDDKSQLIAIIEYYMYVQLSERTRDLYIYSIGGDVL